MAQNDTKFKHGYLYALRLLTVSSRSANQLSERLQRNGYEPELVEMIIRRLENEGVLSDKKLVRESIQYGILGKRWGRNRIMLELRKRGIESPVIEAEMAEYSKETESDLAINLAREKWEKLKHVAVERKRKRIYDFLARQGFDYDLCRSALERAEKNNREEF